MTISRKTIMAITLTGALVAFGALGSAVSARESGRKHHGPPPEAYTACEDKSEGDTAEFVSPRGDTVTGTCELEGDRLVLRPENPPPGHMGRNDADE